MDPVSYSAMEAARRGHDTFVNMKPCKWGHPAPRVCRMDSGACVQCYELRKRKAVRPGIAAAAAAAEALSAILAEGSGIKMQRVEAALVRTAKLIGSGQLQYESLVAFLEAMCPTCGDSP